MPSYQYPKLELKYCERCGGLWLRPQGAEEVYCASCAHAISELPPVSPRGGTPSGTLQAVYVAVAAFCAVIIHVADGIGGPTA